jgi:hypothetical protein
MEVVDTTVNTKTYDLNPDDIANAIHYAFTHGYPVPLLGQSDTVVVTQQEIRPGHPARVVVTHSTSSGNTGT